MAQPDFLKARVLLGYVPQDKDYPKDCNWLWVTYGGTSSWGRTKSLAKSMGILQSLKYSDYY